MRWKSLTWNLDIVCCQPAWGLDILWKCLPKIAYSSLGGKGWFVSFNEELDQGKCWQGGLAKLLCLVFSPSCTSFPVADTELRWAATIFSTSFVWIRICNFFIFGKDDSLLPLSIVVNWRITSLQTCAQTMAQLNIAAALGQRNVYGDNAESPDF